jgi:hypothetical protein
VLVEVGERGRALLLGLVVEVVVLDTGAHPLEAQELGLEVVPGVGAVHGRRHYSPHLRSALTARYSIE